MVDKDVRAAILAESLKLSEMDAELAKAMMQTDSETKNLRDAYFALNSLCEAQGDLLKAHSKMAERRFEGLEQNFSRLTDASKNTHELTMRVQPFLLKLNERLVEVEGRLVTALTRTIDRQIALDARLEVLEKAKS